VLNLTFMDAGGLGIGVTQFADTRDPGTIFFARSLFVTRFEREGLGDLARWWMNHPSRRRGSSARVEGHGRIVFTDGPSAAT
jgi:hypothetical protein